MGKRGRPRQHQAHAILDQGVNLAALRTALRHALYDVDTARLRAAVILCGCGPIGGDCGDIGHRWFWTASALSGSARIQAIGRRGPGAA